MFDEVGVRTFSSSWVCFVKVPFLKANSCHLCPVWFRVSQVVGDHVEKVTKSFKFLSLVLWVMWSDAGVIELCPDFVPS